MEVNNYIIKFKLLFDRMFDEKFELSSYYCENILKHLEDVNNKDVCKFLETASFSDLILHSIQKFKDAKQSVQIFIMEIMTIAFKNELQFCKICDCANEVCLVLQLSVLDPNSMSIPLNMTYIKQMTAKISHRSGVVWLVKHKIWKYIIHPKVHRRPKQIERASYKFIAKLIWKLNEMEDETNLMEVLDFVVTPLKTNGFFKGKDIEIEMEKESIIEPILPYIKTLLEISEDTFSVPVEYNKVLSLLFNYFFLGQHIHFLLEMTRDPETVKLLCEITFRFCYIQVKETENSFNDLQIANFYNALYYLIKKRNVPLVVEFVVKCIIFWYKCGAKQTSTVLEQYGRNCFVQNQFLSMLLCPILVYTKKNCNEDKWLVENVEMFTTKLRLMTHEQIMTIVFMLKELIKQCDMRDLAIQTVRQIFSLKRHLNAEQAGIVYQALFYTLRQNLVIDAQGSLSLMDTKLNCHKDFRLLSLVLDAIRMLLEEHSVNWYENLVIMWLHNTLVNLLRIISLPSRLVVQTVDLVNLSVSQFLSPELALLADTTKAPSTLCELNEVINNLLDSKEWEIRDSALNLLTTCTEIAFVKYTPFQKLISKNKLILRAVDAALNDSAYYVQATALKCLTAAGKMEGITKTILEDYPDIYSQISQILINHSEGIVRKEAAKVLTEIYTYQKNTMGYNKCMTKVMAKIAFTDLHWEVQLAALDFWNKAIQNELSNRGMIDGKFPSVTFSRQKRKILHLTKEEIERQLMSFLNDLSVMGCLAVLNRCMNDDCSIDVMEKAYYITNEFVTILDAYNILNIPEGTDVDSEVPRQNKHIDGRPMDLSFNPLEDGRDEVIDTIMDTPHADIIGEMLENCFHFTPDIYPQDIINLDCSDYVMHPNVFLNDFRSKNYLFLLEAKTSWNSGSSTLNNLLDEILFSDSYDVDERLENDCV